MDWHQRFLQQASWTRELRLYILKTAGLSETSSVLEVGCGTGAILAETRSSTLATGNGAPSLHGIDLDARALEKARQQVPSAHLARADATRLPYAAGLFDLTFCHFLLMWVADPLQAVLEMHRVTQPGGLVAIMAEPDYTSRVDLPSELVHLGMMQTRSLEQQGADPSLGPRLETLIRKTDMEVVETGRLTPKGPVKWDADDFDAEWQVFREDLQGSVSAQELDRLEQLDVDARRREERVLYVPTYFALARV